MIQKTITFWGNFFPACQNVAQRTRRHDVIWWFFITNNSVFDHLIKENDKGYVEKIKSSEKSMLWVSYVLTVIKYEDRADFVY
jgi:hypothetical protein